MKQILTAFLLGAALLTGCERSPVVTHGNLELQFDRNMHTRLAGFESGYQASSFLDTRQGRLDEFGIFEYLTGPFRDSAGKGASYLLKGLYEDGGLAIEKHVEIRAYDASPGFLVFRTTYVNTGERMTDVISWTERRHRVEGGSPGGGEPSFWSFQGESTGARADWILPLEPGFYQENYMGMNNSDYGGGVPVSDVWRRDAGVAVGHLEMVPKLVSLPVSRGLYDDHAVLGITRTFEQALRFAPGDTLETLETFLAVHEGDCFASLSAYSGHMQRKGLRFAETEEDAYEPIWCAWGYERQFTVEEILGTLPKVVELGIKWAVVDDGYQRAEGDWDLDPGKFPGGDRDMRRLVDGIHERGLKAKIWYAPLAADPGSDLLAAQPDLILYNSDWAPQYITWWDSYYLSPVYEKTLDHTRRVITMFMEDWGFDGLKLDGQHMNAVPPDHHPRHNLDYPEQAVEGLPDFFSMIYEHARSIKPDAVVENCPCGTCMSFFNMTTVNQVVSSDPRSSWQIRLKGKVYRALVPHVAYYGDHVELSDGKDDFATTIGIGGVPGTKFTWPADNPHASDTYLLTPEKERIWKKWFSLYNEMMLSRGNYLGGLYDIGFDRPETHVVEKDGAMHYAFYADSWQGEIRFRGLDESLDYTVFDYVNQTGLGTVSGSDPVMNLSFRGSLLVRLMPEQL